MSLSDVDQLLQDAFEHSLLLCLMEGRVNGKHPVSGDYQFFPAGLHNLKILQYANERQGIEGV